MNRDLKYLRYRLYARKSTDTEDKQVQSLDDQVKHMADVAERESLHIVGEPIRESHSARQTARATASTKSSCVYRRPLCAFTSCNAPSTRRCFTRGTAMVLRNPKSRTS